MIAQQQMTREQQDAVTSVVIRRQELAKRQGGWEYPPVIAGIARHDASGKPWLSFDGGRTWHSGLDRSVEDLSIPCVADADGHPLGTASEGPLELIDVSSHRHEKSRYVATPRRANGKLFHAILWPASDEPMPMPADDELIANPALLRNAQEEPTDVLAIMVALVGVPIFAVVMLVYFFYAKLFPNGISKQDIIIGLLLGIVCMLLTMARNCK
jgi:hypothetical protein